MTKLMVWALDEYEKAIYLDSDLIVLRSWDEILSFSVEHGQIFAPSKSYSDPQHFGTYMMALHPSMVRGLTTFFEHDFTALVSPAFRVHLNVISQVPFQLACGLILMPFSIQHLDFRFSEDSECVNSIANQIVISAAAPWFV